MKNKNAEITAEEVLKLVLAVLCIVILVILAAGLYGIFIKKTDLEQARVSLKEIVAEANSLEEGKERVYLVTSPKDWYVLYIDNNAGNYLECKGKSCLCFCPSVNKEECLKQGVCDSVVGLTKVDSQCVKDIDPLGNPLYSFDGCISLEKIPIKIFLENKNGIKRIISENNLGARKTMLELLEYKGDSEVIKVTISELIIKYQKSEKIEGSDLSKSLENSLVKFLDSKEIYVWKFSIIEKAGQKEVLTLKENPGGLIVLDSLSKQTEDIKINDKEYEVVLFI